MFYTPAKTGTSSTQPKVSAKNPPISTPSGTPKMSVLFKDSSNIKVGYFGTLEFLGNQEAFAEVFEYKAKIISPNTTMSQDSTSTVRGLYLFG